MWVVGFLGIAIVIAIISNMANNSSPSAVSYTEPTRTPSPQISSPSTPTETSIPTSAPTQLPINIPKPLPTEVTDDYDVKMVLIPGGEFRMGGENSINGYDLLVHTVFFEFLLY
jgi:hypothetical protein